MSVGVSAIFGFFLIVSLLFSIQDFDKTVDSGIGQPVIQILIDIFGNQGAIALMTLVIVCVWHCGLFSITSNSRMMYGFSRDRGKQAFRPSHHSNFSRASGLFQSSRCPLQSPNPYHLACCFSRVSPCHSVSGVYRRLFRRHLNRNYWPLYIVRHPDSYWTHLSWQFQAWSVQPWGGIQAHRGSCRTLDLFH